MKIKIDNFEIYKLKQAGLSNQQVLKVLQYGEIYDQELSLETIAEASECRNPVVFMERYHKLTFESMERLQKDFEKFPSFQFWMMFIQFHSVKFMMHLYCFFIKEI